MKYALTTTAMVLIALAGCEKSEPTDAYPPAAQNPAPNPDKLVDSRQAAAHRTAVSEWRMELEKAESQVNDLRQHSRLATISPEDKSELDPTLKSLESQADQLKTQLDGFKETDALAWSSFSTDINTKMTRLKTDVRQATDKFLNGAANQPVPVPATPQNPQTPETPPATPQNPSTPPATPDNPGTPQNPGTPPQPQPAPGPDVPPAEPNPR